MKLRAIFYRSLGGGDKMLGTKKPVFITQVSGNYLMNERTDEKFLFYDHIKYSKSASSQIFGKVRG